MSEDNEEQKFFVSRRGRQVGVHEVDLKNMDIESDEPAIVEKSKPVKKLAAKTVKSPRKRRGWTKPKKIAVVVVLVLLLVPIAIGELVAAQYSSGVPSAKSDLAKLVDQTILPLQKKTAITADQIRTSANSVNDIASHMCKGGLLDNMAGLYPRAKSALDTCKTTQRKYSELASSLYDLESQARYLEKLDVLVKPVATPITDAYAVLGAQQTAWQTAAEGVKKLVPPDAMKNAHTELSAHMNTLADAWSKLNTASNAQDGTAFREAEKTLATEYEAVRSTNGQFTERIKTAQAAVTIAYNFLK